MVIGGKENFTTKDTKIAKADTACGEYDARLESNMTLPLGAAAGRKSERLQKYPAKAQRRQDILDRITGLTGFGVWE